MNPDAPKTPAEDGKTRVMERDDGFYWQSRTDDREFGPFPTLLEALQDIEYRDDGAIEPGETVEEAEAEIGIADWVDPETKEPAEENVPRLEDH